MRWNRCFLVRQRVRRVGPWNSGSLPVMYFSYRGVGVMHDAVRAWYVSIMVIVLSEKFELMDRRIGNVSREN